MTIRAYLSGVSEWWTIERQEAVLGAVLPGAIAFRDPLDARQRRGHSPTVLAQRAEMLRATTRTAEGGTIYVASWAVLAWTPEDLEATVASVAARGAQLVSVSEPGPPGVEAWMAARTRSRLEGAALRGAAVSKARRLAATKAAVALIADDWGKPSSEVSTASLLARCGRSYNTVVAQLGGRETAQKRYQAALRRRQKAREARTA